MLNPTRPAAVAAPHAAACCPAHALAALGRWCERAVADPDAEPGDDERPAVERYHRLLRAWGDGWWAGQRRR